MNHLYHYCQVYLLNIIRKWNGTRVSLFEETFLQSTTKINTTSFCSRLKIVAQTQKAIGFTSTEIRRKSFGKVVGKMFLGNHCMKLVHVLLRLRVLILNEYIFTNVVLNKMQLENYCLHTNCYLKIFYWIIDVSIKVNQ